MKRQLQLIISGKVTVLVTLRVSPFAYYLGTVTLWFFIVTAQEVCKGLGLAQLLWE